MSNVINNDKLSFILTSYGLRRIAESISDPNVTLNLSKVIVGDANGEYYEPNETLTELKNPLVNGSFSVLQKELLEDELTVNFLFIMPESFNNCEIREVGLYEVIDEDEYLFAIGTQQPILKPSATDNYFISVEYNIMLKSASLSDVYDQIIINPNNQIVTEQDLENLMSNIVFTQGNLSLQIGNNSHIIGLNRGTMLYENMTKNRDAQGYLCASQMFSTLMRMVDMNNIFSFWLFDYPKTISRKYSITDLSNNKNNLSGNLPVNLYGKSYLGVISSLSFSTPNYYYLGSEIPLLFTDNDTNEDLPFSIIYAIEPLNEGEDRTILARSNYLTSTHAFEIIERGNRSIQIKLFSDSNNYLSFTSSPNQPMNKKHSVILSYDNLNKSFTAFINGKSISLVKEETGEYTNMSTTPTTLYGFSFDTSQSIYADSDESVTSLFNEDGSPYTGDSWLIFNAIPYYEQKISSYAESSVTNNLYAWSYTEVPTTHTIYTKTQIISPDTILYNEDFTEYTGEDFTITLSGDTYIIQYNSNATIYDSSRDINKTIYKWTCELATVNIWSNSNTNPVMLFNSDGNLYEGSEWSISGTDVLYQGQVATYNSSLNFDIPALEVTSYIINTSGQKEKLINSNISIIAITKGQALSETDAQLFSLELGSAIGNNPCLNN